MFDWSSYLQLAEELARDPREQHARAAISRAYYAAFNHARKFVERASSSTIPPDGRAHEQVPAELSKMGKQFVGPSNKLMELKKLRTWADYHASQKLNMAGEVQKALAHTKWIIEKLQ